MRNLIFTTALCLASIFAFGQVDVILKINHKLGNAAFAYGTAATNNLGNDFNVSRLQYYVAEVTLIHDGGQETTVPAYWILVDAGTAVSENLGNFNITQLEGIKMGIGVEPAFNHLDPASYPATHPLAPKAPSMHWGWASGYRFVALEGKGGSGLNQTFEIHALGDDNYHTLTVPTNGTLSGNELTVELDADYTGAIKNIDVSNGNIMHGETGIAADLLVNFAYSVFSAQGAASMGISESEKDKFAIGPNPSQGTFTIHYSGEKSFDVSIMDATGRIIEKATDIHKTRGFSIQQNGIYFVAISQNGQAISIEKIVVAQ